MNLVALMLMKNTKNITHEESIIHHENGRLYREQISNNHKDVSVSHCDEGKFFVTSRKFERLLSKKNTSSMKKKKWNHSIPIDFFQVRNANSRNGKIQICFY